MKQADRLLNLYEACTFYNAKKLTFKEANFYFTILNIFKY